MGRMWELPTSKLPTRLGPEYLSIPYLPKTVITISSIETLHIPYLGTSEPQGPESSLQHLASVINYRGDVCPDPVHATLRKNGIGLKTVGPLDLIRAIVNSMDARAIQRLDIGLHVVSTVWTPLDSIPQRLESVPKTPNGVAV